MVLFSKTRSSVPHLHISFGNPFTLWIVELFILICSLYNYVIENYFFPLFLIVILFLILKIFFLFCLRVFFAVLRAYRCGLFLHEKLTKSMPFFLNTLERHMAILSFSFLTFLTFLIQRHNFSLIMLSALSLNVCFLIGIGWS